MGLILLTRRFTSTDRSLRAQPLIFGGNPRLSTYYYGRIKSFFDLGFTFLRRAGFGAHARYVVWLVAVWRRVDGRKGTQCSDDSRSDHSVNIGVLLLVNCVALYHVYKSAKLWCSMEPPGGRESRLNLNAYNMDLVSGGWPSTSLQPSSPRHMTPSFTHRGMKSDTYDERGLQSQTMALDGIVNDMPEDPYNSQMQPKKSPPSNGKKTKGRVKIKMEYIENKLRRYTTFSKRKTGIMKKVILTSLLHTC